MTRVKLKKGRLLSWIFKVRTGDFSKILLEANWATTQAKLERARYMPRTFPIAEFLEKIFKISSSEKTVRVFRAKYKINIGITPQASFTKVNDKRERALSNVTESKNLYPPTFLNIWGVIKSAKIEAIDARI